MTNELKNILVTGSSGFLGKNLIFELRRRANLEIMEFDLDSSQEDLKTCLGRCDLIFHLAGVNRPQSDEDFKKVNTGLTRKLVDVLIANESAIPIVFSSSVQALQDNPYGLSKLEAESILTDYSKNTGAKIIIYRLPNVFGKWCRPNYNSVVATFCHNIVRGMPIRIDDEDKVIEMAFVDCVVNAFTSHLDSGGLEGNIHFPVIEQTYKIRVGELAARLRQLHDIRKKLLMPDLEDELTRYLYSTYLSYLPENEFSYSPPAKEDTRGNLVELFKSKSFGQIFVSSSQPGIVRGNHYHNRKIEKFCVLYGRARIRLRSVLSNEVLEYDVSGERIDIVDIPPGYTHSIENLSSSEELRVLFWASEIFDPQNQDTYSSEVQS